MADDSSEEKTEAPTEYKLRKLREKGQVPRSRDFGSVVVLIAMFGLIAASLSSGTARLSTLLRDAAALGLSAEVTPGELVAFARRGLSESLSLLALPLSLAAAAGLVAAYVQVGAVFTVHPLVPDLTRLDVVKGLQQRIFSMSAQVEFLKALLKLTLTGGAVYVVLRGHLPDMLALAGRPLEAVLGVAAVVLWELVLTTLAVLLPLGLVDVVYQRWEFHRKQRMGATEIKEEYKDQEGSPENRAARDQLQQRILQQAQLRRVPEGTFATRNPTHLVVVFRWRHGLDDVPRVIAKGRGLVAQRILEILDEHRVPTWADVALTRMLDRRLELDEQLPEDLQRAILPVLRWVAAVARRRGQQPAWLPPEGDHPMQP